MKSAGRRSRIGARAARMLMPGEVRILAYLRKRRWATVAEVAKACLPDTPEELVSRILGNLDWLGYVTAYPGPGGAAAALQITPKGLAAAGGRPVAAQP